MYINVLQYLEETAKRVPDKIVYKDGNNEICFSELLNKAQRIGSALSTRIPPNSPVVVFSDKCIDTPVLYLGILYAGCYYVPIGTDLPEFRMKVILETIHADILLTHQPSLELAKSLGGSEGILCYEELLECPIDSAVLENRRRAVTDTDPAYIIFTSGSSGKPKGVIESHRALIDYIEVFTSTFDIQESERFGNQAPLDYIAAIRDIYLPLKTGASMVMISKTLFSLPGKLFDYINENQITTICWVVSALSICSDLKAFNHTKLNTVSKVFFTGSVMPCRQLRYWQEQLPEAMFVNHYGPTEITASCTYYIVDHIVENDEILPIGLPFKNTSILLLKEDNTVPDAGERGEICVKGSCLALGYYENKKKTDEVFVANPLNPVYSELIYKTGDIGSWDENGLLWFHGRLDFQIKHAGHRIELAEIEATTKTLEDILECTCLYHKEKEQLWLFYSSLTSEHKDVATYLRNRLPSYMVPRKMVKLESLPKSFNGKIDLEQLRKSME
jgi:D-alanine--poly(phosphoribitol) ligase subunit 1